jgi:NAD(P)-dependent dehydrogenase (short-subunit alcohol dehydrogenase family)
VLDKFLKEGDKVMAQTSSNKQPCQNRGQLSSVESQITSSPTEHESQYRGSNKLKGRVALITGGDSGIGRAVAIFFAKEGADVAIMYLDEHEDAHQTKRKVEQLGRRCVMYAGDIGEEALCQRCVEQTIQEFGRLDILVNNAAEQHPKASIEDISAEQLERTFRTNIFGYFYMTKVALPYLKPGSTIINTTSVAAYRGNPQLLDYAATKGAIVAFTRSLSQALVAKNIRVNGVAPGPILTPLLSTFEEPEYKELYDSSVPMRRVGVPEEVAPCFVFLASEDSSYMSGQILHPNGGEVING